MLGTDAETMSGGMAFAGHEGVGSASGLLWIVRKVTIFSGVRTVFQGTGPAALQECRNYEYEEETESCRYRDLQDAVLLALRE